MTTGSRWHVSPARETTDVKHLRQDNVSWHEREVRYGGRTHYWALTPEATVTLCARVGQRPRVLAAPGSKWSCRRP